MSAEAVGWVYRHSPYRGVVLQVHLAVADSVNDQYDNRFFMTLRRLAEKARCERARASDAIAQLAKDGYLEVLVKSKGPTPSEYRFAFPDVPVVYETRTVLPRHSRPTVPPKHGKRAATAQSTVLPGHGLSRTQDQTQEEPNTDTAPDLDPFDAFWSVYPRHDDKQAARRKFKQALKSADADVIIAGAQRYRDDPNRDPAYTKYAATWLHAGSWDNGPLPARGKSNGKVKASDLDAVLAERRAARGVS